MKMLYFKSVNTSFRAKVFVVPQNDGKQGRSVFIHEDNSMTTGLPWNISEFSESSWKDGGRPIRISRKEAERLMGNRSTFRSLVQRIRLEA